jgi:hypothetical protein
MLDYPPTLIDPRRVKTHGVVPEAGRAVRLNLSEAIAGEPIRGSWWGHRKGRASFRATRTLRDCDQVLVRLLVGGRITYVHRRLWPAITRLANSLDKTPLLLSAEHTPSGAHRVARSRFHAGFHLKSVNRPRTSPRRRRIFNWVTGCPRKGHWIPS